MKTLGVRELKSHASEVLQELAQSGEEAVIVSNGKPVARLVPPRKKPFSAKELEEWDKRADALAARITALWNGSTDAAEVMREDRERWP
jgi:prevent-host-death family protein